MLLCTLVLAPLAPSRAEPAPTTPVPPFAERATVVADIETDPQGIPWEPRDFTGNGTVVFFSAHTASGRELLRIDTSGSGALLVADIRKGFASSEPANLKSVGSTLFFSADDGIHGRELWRSDGTPDGTSLVKDIYPGAASALPSVLVVREKHVFFTADDGIHGRELWISDGTSQGTQQVADIAAGNTGSNPQELTLLGATLFFTAEDDATGRELWQSDGTAEGTLRVRDIMSGADDSAPQGLTALHENLFFTTNDGRLWRTDGVTGTTEILHPLHAAENILIPTAFIAADSQIFFQIGDNELWRSDGTPQGTRLVRNDLESSFGHVVLGNVLFFNTPSPFHYDGRHTWRSDGTTAGTFILPINTPTGMVSFNGRVYYQGYDETAGYELFSSDGTLTGQQLVSDLSPGEECYDPEKGGDPVCEPRSSELTHFRVANGMLFFNARTDPYDSEGSGIWSSDGMAQGTHHVAQPYDSPTGTYGSHPRDLIDVNGTLFFSGEMLGGNSTGISSTNGTASTTVNLSEPAQKPFFSVSNFFRRKNGEIFFLAGDSTRSVSLWRTTLRTGSMTLIKSNVATTDSDAAVPNPTQIRLFEVGGILLFNGYDPEHGWELWRSDGTEAGTFLLKDIVEGSDSSVSLSALSSVGQREDRIFFKINNGTYDELWSSDGTAAGTNQVHSAAPDVRPIIATIQMVGSSIFFTGYDAFAPPQKMSLWRTNGTPNSAKVLKTVNEPDKLFALSPLSSTRLIFAVGQHNAETKRSTFKELWVSDGTSDGTRLLRTFAEASDWSDDVPWTEHAGSIFFAATGEEGQELWKTDGTVEGTILVKDINPGSGCSSPAHLTAIGDRFYFSADDGEHGRELWMSDGTTEGTQFIQDLYPGSGSGEPYNFVRSGQRLYFSAHHPVFGRELWSIPFIFEVKSRVYLPLIQQQQR